MQKQKLWFRAKRYGWGWYPSSWQGWVFLLAWVINFIFIISNIDKSSENASKSFIQVFVSVLILVIILLFVCYAHGEKPRWRWG
jgi:hypothetical protein